MNDHEIERIAAAANQLRPDWPIQQLRTLLRDDRITSRPRRDVAVALMWVGCEPNSASPYRVLGAGPWWKAAGTEGTARTFQPLEAHERCGICARRRDECERAPRFADDDHAFEPDHKHKRDGETVRQIVDSIKAEVTPTAEPAPVKSLDDIAPEARNPRVAELRAVVAQEAS